MESGN